MGTNLGRYEYVALQIIALGLHVQKLGCNSQCAECAVSVGYEANHLRTRADTAQTSQKTDSRSGSTLCLTVGTGDANLYHIGAALGSLQRVNLHVCLGVHGKQIILNGCAVYCTAVENIENLHNLFDKHDLKLPPVINSITIITRFAQKSNHFNADF